MKLIIQEDKIKPLILILALIQSHNRSELYSKLSCWITKLMAPTLKPDFVMLDLLISVFSFNKYILLSRVMSMVMSMVMSIVGSLYGTVNTYSINIQLPESSIMVLCFISSTKDLY